MARSQADPFGIPDYPAMTPGASGWPGERSRFALAKPRFLLIAPSNQGSSRSPSFLNLFPYRFVNQPMSDSVLHPGASSKSPTDLQQLTRDPDLLSARDDESEAHD